MEKMIRFSVVLITLLSRGIFLATAQDATLTINYAQALPNDTLQLYLLPPEIPCTRGTLENQERQDAVQDKDGAFRFHLASKKLPLLVWLKLVRHDNLKNDLVTDQIHEHKADVWEFYPVQKGDQVAIGMQSISKIRYSSSGLHNFKLAFAGPGATKYSVRQTIDSIWYHTDFDIKTSAHRYVDTNNTAKSIARALDFIERNKSSLLAEDYVDLKVHALYFNKNKEAITARNHYEKEFINWTEVERKAYMAAYRANFDPKKYGIPERVLMRSQDYMEAELQKEILLALVSGKADFSMRLFKGLHSDLLGGLREKVMIAFLTDEMSAGPDETNQLFESVGRDIKTPRYRAMYDKLLTRMIGRSAYDFALPDASDATVRLQDFKGKVVFMDFWFTGCVNCKNFYSTTLSKVEERYRDDPDVVFVSVSIDKTKTDWLKSVNSDTYTSPRAVNLYTGGQGTHSDIINYYHVSLYPQPIVIGKDHKLKATNVSFRTEKEIVELIDQLKAFH